MNMIRHTMQRYLSAFGVLALTFAPAIQQAMAAPGTISQIPLYVGPSVEPNVLFVADDSGSMDWGLMTSESDGIMYLGGLDYYYTQPAAGNDWTWVLPAEEYMIDVKGVAAPALGVWRAWNHNYNTIYYNPEITYRPWAGLDSSGVAYANASPTAARVNPYKSSDGTVNLTNKNTSYATDYPSMAAFTVTHFYPARYYTWTDSDSDGVVDAGDAHTLVEITNAATYKTTTPPSSYTGSAQRTDCAAAPVCTYAEEIQNFANWFSYYRKRDLTLKAAISLSAADMTGVRMGYATINNNGSVNTSSSGSGNRVASMNLSPTTGNKKKMYEKLFKSDPNNGTPLQTALRDTGKYFECKSGNILGVSGTNCPILPEANGGQCQKNFAILMTDGFYNGSSPSLSPSNSDGDGNTDFDGDPYGDSYTNTLADVAMHYYERDLSTSRANEVPVWEDSVDQARHQHMNTYTVAFGVNGTLDPFDTKTPGDASDTDPTADGFAWPDPDDGDAQKIDDLWHAAYNGRGQFYSAQDSATLASGLAAAFASVTRGTSSSSAVAFNTTTLDTGSRVFQATFNPSDNWYGDLLAYELAIDGTIGDTPAWHASDVLDAMAPGDRVILTYNEASNEGVAFRTLSDLSTKQQNDLKTSPSGTADALGQARLDYLRGVRTDENAGNNFRERTNVLGDIVYSNPVYVGPPQSGYSDDAAFGGGTYDSFNPSRAPIIYVGSNDGMLHGFRESDGQEVFAYIPNMLFSNATTEGLHYLTDPAYEHRFYVDLSPSVADVYINSHWKTVLIGGYRAGARGLFALDVTDPDGITDSDANTTVLWEFTSNDDDDLGYSFSKPTMALMENGQWAAVFGNGYNDLGDGQAKLFILYLEEGADRTWSSGDYKVITTGVGSSGDRNGLSTPALVDTDGNGKADRVYAGDLKGNLWAFDLSDTTNDAAWGVAYGKALFNATEPAATPQPITSKPVVARNPATSLTISNTPNILVFFGTGQYIVTGDKTSSSTQTFYGVWDNNDVGSGSTLTRSNLIEQELDGGYSTEDIRVVTDNDVNYGSKYGWFFDLPTSGERVVVDPKIRGEYVFFNTLIPDPNTCNTQGYGWLMALRMVNGGEPSSPVFDINGDGEVDEHDQIALDEISKNPSGVRLDGIPAGSNFLEDYMYTPDDDGDIDVRKIDAGDSNVRGRLSWREVSQ